MRHSLKEAITAAILLAASSCATPAVAALDEKQEQICSAMSSSAETIMQERQRGADMQALMQRAIEANAIYEDVVVEAYDAPRYATKRHQRREIKRFKNRWYAICHRAMSQ